MITVEVVSIGGVPPPRPMSAQIDQRGGTVGRSPDCSLVLNDEKRAVSRVHAEFSFSGGAFQVTDQGTNPLKLNGVPLGKGNTTPVKNGDRIVIGPFEMEVRAAGSAASAPARPPAAPPSRSFPAADAESSASPFDDIFGAGSGGSAGAPSSSGSVFDDLGFGPAPSPAPKAPAAASSNPYASSSGLPADFDPMAPARSDDDMLPPAGADLPDDAFGALMSADPVAPGEGSLDALFGLSGSGSSDPFAGSPLDKPAPSHAGGTDSGLTQFLGGIKKPVAAAMPDQVPEINSAFQPPRAMPSRPPAELPDDLADFAPAAPPKVAPPPPMPPPAAPAPWAARPPLPTAPPAPRPRPSGPGAPSAELLDAFMAGLNAPDLVIDELTPELMQKIGALMHEATAGTIALLGARGTVKREMRADVTMIASGRNNPLKFSPDARLALRYLFGPPMPGFMEASEAMQDAYNDLRAHEFGFMAGLRAALTGVLKRFEPEQLQGRLPDKGGFNALMPANRKAKLWDLFSELYRQLSTEAEEDFHALFGREFLRAYEEHVAAVERNQRKK